MKSNSIDFLFKARYFQIGNISPTTKQIIFALHGYGQQARYFINKFSELGQNDICIIAPEGLSRFYLEGFSGRVGATWMTKEDRLTDIENYINYLDSLYTKVKDHIPKHAKINVLGFSQGSATASRWVMNGNITFSKLVLWAGIFPPDMNFEKASNLLSEKDIHYVYGDNDPFISSKRLEEMRKLSRRLKVNPTVTTFKGDHRIDRDTLKAIFLHHG